MMPNVIEITKEFPPSRERAVLLELLRVVTGMQDAGIQYPRSLPVPESFDPEVSQTQADISGLIPR
jgi:hypothetical protein